MAKLIGITPRILIEDGVEKQFVNTRYINHLNKRGFNTIQINLNNPKIDEILILCDAFLITGGTDMDPKFYNEVNEGLSKGIDLRLDLLDEQIVEHAVKKEKPLLGICRGFQSINVFMGGSLHQDLGDLNPTHNNISKDHIVHLTKHPLFNWDSPIKVNSYHHQAVNKVADKFDVIGRHEDGTVEMIVHQTLPIIGIQWHPEIDNDPASSNIIFDAFSKLILE